MSGSLVGRCAMLCRSDDTVISARRARGAAGSSISRACNACGVCRACSSRTVNSATEPIRAGCRGNATVADVAIFEDKSVGWSSSSPPLLACSVRELAPRTVTAPAKESSLATAVGATVLVTGAASGTASVSAGASKPDSNPRHGSGRNETAVGTCVDAPPRAARLDKNGKVAISYSTAPHRHAGAVAAASEYPPRSSAVNAPTMPPR